MRSSGRRSRALSGLSLEVNVRSSGSRIAFDEDLLFTHRGLSGPAILQISTFWEPGDASADRSRCRGRTWRTS